MARDKRERSVRRDPSLREGTRPVQLEVSRRFQSPAGHDRANREARALSELFGAGTELYQDIQVKRNEEGGAQAAFESAAGKTRDAENTNKGYMEMWDQIEAKNDLHRFTKELPELLRGADWENLTEEEAQGVIDGYFEDQLKGINANSVYGKMVAEGIFKQNAELIETHKNFQLERIKQEQRTLILEEAGVSYENDGVLDYETLMNRTGLAFDGDEKMENWINILEALAVQYEDETIIDNMPDRFPLSGDPSGKSDPRFTARLNTARNKARAAREATERKEAAAAKAAREARREEAMVDLSELAIEGQDPIATALEMAQLGIIDAADITTIGTAYRTIRSDRAKHGFDPERIAQYQTTIALNPNDPMLKPDNLLMAFADGVFGPPESPEARTLYRQTLQDREQAQERKQRIAQDPAKRVWVGRFNEAYPVPKNQFGFPVPGVLTELRAAYSAEFELAILNAPADQYATIFEAYAKRYKEQEKLVSAQENSRTANSVLRNLRRENFNLDQAAAQMRYLGLDALTLSKLREDGELGDPDALMEDQHYLDLLKALMDPVPAPHENP